MTARLALTIPYPPAINHLWRYGPYGQVYKTATGKAFDVQVAVLVRQDGRWQSMQPPYRVTLELWLPDRRRRDVDGPIKATLDAVWGGLGQNDVTIEELHVYRRGLDREHPRAEVLVETVDAHA